MPALEYTLASLPSLAFDAPAPLSWEAFVERTGFKKLPDLWVDLETQLKNAIAQARGGDQYVRTTHSLSLYWKGRIFAAFQESDILKRDEMINRTFWDAAGELTPSHAPFSNAALATYAVRLKIALKRGQISSEAGNSAFDELTARTEISL